MKKVSELETIVEDEKINLLKLNEECSSFKKEALLAREEFEREYKGRMQLEDIIAAHEADYGNYFDFAKDLHQVYQRFSVELKFICLSDLNHTFMSLEKVITKISNCLLFLPFVN